MILKLDISAQISFSFILGFQDLKMVIAKIAVWMFCIFCVIYIKYGLWKSTVAYFDLTF